MENSKINSPRVEGTSEGTKNAFSFSVGDKVEVNYRSRGRFYPGKVTGAKDAAFIIAYDDGEDDTSGTVPDLIRKASAEADNANKILTVGDRIEASVKGVCYYGKINAVVPDVKLCDIELDDDDQAVLTSIPYSAIKINPTVQLDAKHGAIINSIRHGVEKKLTIEDQIASVTAMKSLFSTISQGNSKIGRKQLLSYINKTLGYDVPASDFEDIYNKFHPEPKGGVYDYKLLLDFFGLSTCVRRTADDPAPATTTTATTATEAAIAAPIAPPAAAAPAPVASVAASLSSTEPTPAPTTTAAAASVRAAFKVGEKVEANYRGRGKFYPAKIKRVRVDDTYDIDYDDGESESQVIADMMRSLELTAIATEAAFKEGEKIEANYRGRGKYYSAKIKQVREDGTYNVDYDDGESETRLKADMIRSLEVKAKAAEPAAAEGEPVEEAATPVADQQQPVLGEGSKVEGNYRGRGKWYPAKIRRVHNNEDGLVLYDIDYDDGEMEVKVKPDCVHLIGGEAATTAAPTPVASTAVAGLPKEGDKVEGNYRGRGKYYPARIKRDREDGTYDIDYDDGESETRVKLAWLHNAAGHAFEAAVNTAAAFKEGEKVEANYRGKGKFYSAKIKRVREDGTYDIDYDDGETEQRVKADMIRSLEKKPEQLQQQLTVGSKVEANYRGRGKFYPGKVVKVHTEEAEAAVTYDVDYDDGEAELRVKADWVRLVGGGSTATAQPAAAAGASKLQEGDKVEANYRGRGKYYPARIKQDRGDGTYDVDYDDGEKETRVKDEWIRSLEKKKDSSSPPARAAVKLALGMKVEGNYRGRCKFYSGKIVKVHEADAEYEAAATYDIDYDDGETEKKVPADRIRSLESSSSPSGSAGSIAGKLHEGDKVEANYRGRGKYYPARIKRDRGDGTYDVDYDDGEAEMRVKEEWIHSLEKKAASGSGVVWKEGMKVEANYKGRGRFFPGHIRRSHNNGTYDIEYDDGEEELRSKEEWIRPVIDVEQLAKDAAAAAEALEKASKQVYAVGADVEWKAEGMTARYVAAKIAAVYPEDNSYDLTWDEADSDHSEEDGKKVQARSLRLLEDDSIVKLAVGDKVEANYRKKGKYYPGKVKAIHQAAAAAAPMSKATVKEDEDEQPANAASAAGPATYDIDYDDGEVERNIDRSYIRALSKPATTTPAAADAAGYQVDDLIEVNYKGRGRYYPGKIIKNHGDGTYDLSCDDDGSIERNIADDLLRKKGDTTVKGRLRLGDKVEVNFRGKGKYFPAHIKREHGDDTYDIDYDDGEEEKRVAKEMIRTRPAVASGSRSKSAPTTSLREGDKVEANFKGRGKYYPGRIRRDRGDATYDIDYDDGEAETRMKEEWIRPKQADASSRGRHKFQEGDKVEANYRGRGYYLPGRIKQDRGDGFYSIDYDDGEAESRVPAADILMRDSSNSRSSFHVGEKVEANYRSKGKYYPARIKRDRGDDTYDIDYDDGEYETRVKADYIRSMEKDAGSNHRSRSPVARSASHKAHATFHTDDKVEANYRGKGRYFPGKIRRDRGDDTYDVEYDDGEFETRVKVDMIRSLQSSSHRSPGSRSAPDSRTASAAAASFDIGEKVEVNFRGRGKFYPGKILRDRGDGSYDVDYDDGEMERRVHADLIRSIDNSRITSYPKSRPSPASPPKRSHANEEEDDDGHADYGGTMISSRPGTASSILRAAHHTTILPPRDAPALASYTVAWTIAFDLNYCKSFEDGERLDRYLKKELGAKQPDDLADLERQEIEHITGYLTTLGGRKFVRALEQAKGSQR